LIPLKTIQKNAIDNLTALMTFEATEIVRVYFEPQGAINELPALLIFDEGMTELRPGNARREIEWHLRLQVLAQEGDSVEAYELARDIRANLVDKLGEDITLGGVVQRTTWRDPIQLLNLRWGDADHAGVDGVYTIWLNDSRTFS
jgi:hypothetical protein